MGSNNLQFGGGEAHTKPSITNFQVLGMCISIEDTDFIYYRYQ